MNYVTCRVQITVKSYEDGVHGCLTKLYNFIDINSWSIKEPEHKGLLKNPLSDVNVFQMNFKVLG